MSDVQRIPPVDPEAINRVESVCRQLAFTTITAPKNRGGKPSAKRVLHYHPNGCISINGKIHSYANVTIDGVSYRAHRVAYAKAYGECPDDLYVHHRCGNPGCVNPEHLRLVSDHNHAMSHARFQHVCELAVSQGKPRPRFIEVVGT